MGVTGRGTQSYRMSRPGLQRSVGCPLLWRGAPSLRRESHLGGDPGRPGSDGCCGQGALLRQTCAGCHGDGAARSPSLWTGRAGSGQRAAGSRAGRVAALLGSLQPRPLPGRLRAARGARPRAGLGPASARPSVRFRRALDQNREAQRQGRVPAAQRRRPAVLCRLTGARCLPPLVTVSERAGVGNMEGE